MAGNLTGKPKFAAIWELTTIGNGSANSVAEVKTIVQDIGTATAMYYDLFDGSLVDTDVNTVFGDYESFHIFGEDGKMIR